MRPQLGANDTEWDIIYAVFKKTLKHSTQHSLILRSESTWTQYT